MNKVIRLLVLFTFSIIISIHSNAQTSQEFWFAAPTVTEDHGGTNVPILLRFTSTSIPANVTISMPANGAFAPINFAMPANASHTEDLTAFVSAVMTPSNDGANNNGLHIVSDANITCYYEVDTHFNPEIWALKGANGLGQEFYVTVQNQWTNGNYAPDFPYTSFDIVATEDNTVVSIYPKTDLDFGHPALTPYTIFLDKGETYSGSVGKFDQSIPASQNPTGAVIISTKDIAVSVKDDSVNPTGYGGCRDIMGDQIVPTDILGMEYIAQKGFLVAEDKVYVLAIENNTQVMIDGALQATLFGGQLYTYDLANPVVFVNTSKPAYVYQASGFGCEVGMAILPPLNCAGSEEVSFTRSSTEQFGMNIMIRAGSEGDFELNGDPNIIVAGDFQPVPGNPIWVYAQKSWGNGDESVIPAGTAQRLVNTSSVFTLGLINGGSSSGCRFGYFSEFSAEVLVVAGPDDVVCGNDSLQLNGDVSGGSIQGFWTTSGTGTFVPDENQLDAIYAPSVSDEANGSVTLTLTSVGSCFPEIDQMVVSVTPSPTIDLGSDLDACSNNPDVALAATTTIATNALWSGGNGSFVPSNVGLNVTYQPTALEITSGSVTLFAQSAGQGSCNPVMDDITINFTPSPTADAGPNQSVCENNADINLAGSVTLATGGIWSGNGVFTPSTVALNAVYTPTALEISSGSVTLTLTTTGNGNCIAETDQITINFTPAPIVDAGASGLFCSNNSDIALNGSVSSATGGQWTGGLGSYNPNSQTLNAVYSPSAAELSSGSVTLTLESTGNGTCSPVTDIVTYNFTPSPTVDAGSDKSVCGNNADVNLSGAVTVATGGQWSGGSGSFSPNNNSLNVTYSPTAAEVTAGSVKLFLTTTGNGTCNAEKDSLTIAFTPTPIANAGADQTVCENNSDVSLNGSVSVATGGLWTGGSGVYAPSAAALNAVYTPTPTEISNGTLVLTLTTTGNGTCNAESDQLTLTFTAAPVVDAGIGNSLCSNNADIDLNGSVSGASGGQWTGGLGSFNPDNQALNAVYTPSASELTAGNVTLTLESTGNGTCNVVSDVVTYNFTPSPTVDAGFDQSVCGNNADVGLSGAVTVATGGQWSGGNGSFVPNNNSLNVTYSPSASEITAGSVKLYLTTTGNGTCNAEIDSLTITFTPAPIANAGADQTVCENNSDVSLNGSVSVATGGQWSGGSGVYTPSAAALNAIYTPTPTEISNGTLILTLTTTGNGTCNAENDQITLTFTAAPVVDAGTGGAFCSNNADIDLNGSVSGAAGGQWTGGLGSFNPDNQALNATYTPSASELTAGNVTLTLESTGNGTCNVVTDVVTYNFTPSPTVNAGTNQSICENNADVGLSGSVTIATGGQWSGGNGSYLPNANSLIATYSPTAIEIASGSLKLYLTTSGNGTCNSEVDSLTITFTPAPIANAGEDQTVCANDVDVNLNGNVIGATGGQWTGGNGTYNPSAIVPNPLYTPSADEISAGLVTLTFSTTGNGNCNPESDDILITITDAPVVNAGNDLEYCSNNPLISLNGAVSGATGGVWSGGLGIFNPDNQTLNAIYTPSAAEVSLGTLVLTLTSTGNGVCIATEDQVTFTFGPSPVVDAGSDVAVCADNASIPLSGSVSVAGGGQWSGGTGTFVPNVFDLNATYNASAADISLGQIILYLTSTSNGSCNAEMDSVIIDFEPIAVADAGSDQSSCSNNAAVLLEGVVAGATGGEWSGGTGVFNPSNISLNATYIPSPAEITAGTVTLILTTTGSTLCTTSSDEMIITINPSPIVSAGANQEACANNATVQLSGSVQFATGAEWSGGNGTFSPAPSALNAIYTPTAAEITSGNVILTLTSTGNGSCNAEFDQVQVFYTPAPVVNAGLDESVCANNAIVNLLGSVTGASGGVWSGGLGTFSPSNTSLFANYVPHPTEIANGSVTLTLTSTGNGSCASESDEMTIDITPAPVVDAGPDVTNCVDDLNVPLNGSVNGPTANGIWSTSGTGFFVPNNLDLNATYVISSQDSINGGATIYLTSVNNGNCLPVVDSLLVSVFPVGTANAGNDQTVCANNNPIQLDGQISGAATSGVWSSAGSGIFNPNNLTLNAIYIPSDDDILNGSVVLTLTANACNDATDNITITYSPAPSVFAGDDQTVCITNLDVTLNGFVSGGASTGVWTSSGTGTFVPDANTLNAVYQLSSVDSLNQHVMLVLTSTGNGDCFAVADTMEISVFPPGTADAGSDETICSNDSEVQLNGSVSGGADIGQWSTSGSGIFMPNDTTMNAVYQPSGQDGINGSVTITLTTVNSCNMANDAMVITILPGPIVTVYNDTTICGTNPVLDLFGSVQNATGGLWSTSGTGSFGNPTSLNTLYTASEADVTAGVVSITLTSTGNGLCSESTGSFDLTFSDGIFVNAGEDQQVCVSAISTTLNGTINNGSSTGTWTTTGDGTFSDNMSLNAIYTFGATDVASGLVTFTLESTNNGNCSAEADQMAVTFGNTVYVFAGDDETFCADVDAVALNGVISGGSSTGIWGSSGTGSFVPDNTTLDATYIPSTGDSILGGFNLMLVSTNNGGCLAGNDTATYLLNPLPILDAGLNQVVCGGTDTVHLEAIALNINQILWTSSGNGVFDPDENTLGAIYIASADDQLNGSVELIISSLNSEPCGETSDTLMVEFAEDLIANAGDDITTCADNLTIQLDGLVIGTSTGEWTTSGSGFFFPGSDVLNAQYFASTTDSLSGTVLLYLTTSGAMGCDPGVDSLTLTIELVPVADAGESVTVCTGITDIQLNGSVENALEGTWGTNGTGTFNPSPNALDAIYTLSEADIASGNVILSLTTIQSGICFADIDTMQIVIVNDLMADAGDNINTCADNLIIQLDGSVSGTSTGEWSTSGSGFFSPGPETLDAQYIASQGDALVGEITLYLSTSNTQGCPPGVDSLLLIIDPVPEADAGDDITVCEGTSEVQLQGIIINSITGIWTTDGSGTFVPSANDMNAVYVFSNQDLILGSVAITLSTEQSGACTAHTDTIIVDINNPLIAYFGWTGQCEQNTIQFTDSTIINAGTIESFEWDFGDGTQSLVQNPAHIFEASGTFDVQLIVHSNLGCNDSTILQVQISANPQPGFDFEETDNTFEVQFLSQAVGATLFDWEFGDGSALSQEENPSHQYPEEGVYTVTQFVSNDAGCSDSLSQVVSVTNPGTVPPKTPDAFSPNNDGVNDIFYVRGGPFNKMNLKIYDGWGELIYETNDIEGGWDGTYKGQKVQMGVYIYVVDAIGVNGNAYKIQGNVSLIK